MIQAAKTSRSVKAPRTVRRRETGALFEKTLQKTRAWIKDIKEELHFASTQDAYAALRAVLHALRDRLTVEEAAEFGAQLPMLVRGFYFEGWEPSGKPLKVRDAQEFLNIVQKTLVFPRENKDVKFITTGVFKVIEKRLAGGEIQDIKSNLSKDILSLWPAPETPKVEAVEVYRASPTEEM